MNQPMLDFETSTAPATKRTPHGDTELAAHDGLSIYERPHFIPKPFKLERCPKGVNIDDHITQVMLRQGRIVEGHKDWRTPEQVAAWFAQPRAELNGLAWRDVFVPWSHDQACRFIAEDKEKEAIA